MTKEMIEAAYELEAAAKKYRKLYEKEEDAQPPVIYIKNNDTGDCVFMTDSFNGQMIRSHLDI